MADYARFGIEPVVAPSSSLPEKKPKGQMTRDEIMWLMSMFDDARSSYFECYYGGGDMSAWKPGTAEEIEAFRKLTAFENRVALREWFSSVAAINEGAETFRQVLRKATGEKLPLGKPVA